MKLMNCQVHHQVQVIKTYYGCRNVEIQSGITTKRTTCSQGNEETKVRVYVDDSAKMLL